MEIDYENEELKQCITEINMGIIEDILHEEPDFSSIKSNETITGYGPCGERDLPFLTEDPPSAHPERLWAHFDCIDKKHMLCPKCPSIDDLEKEGYYISPTSNEASKKRKRQGGSRKSTTQTIIRELSIRPPSGISIDAPSEDSDMREVSNQFHKFYYDIDNAE
ncbi:hypothetical protein RhiirB3_501998 [Rhizophagus irregularis]|nr:hypothetical protein RhiirB3_501998 [Rhizophagus irregularis]